MFSKFVWPISLRGMVSKSMPIFSNKRLLTDKLVYPSYVMMQDWHVCNVLFNKVINLSLFINIYKMYSFLNFNCSGRLWYSYVIGTSIIAHCYYTTLPYHILLLSITRYAGIYRHAAGPCGYIWLLLFPKQLFLILFWGVSRVSNSSMDVTL